MLVGKPVSIGSSGSPVAPSATRSPVIPSRSNNENDSKPLKSFPVSSAVKTSPVAQPPSYMKCLPMQDLPSDRPLVMPCFLEGPDEFYVQSLDTDCVARFTDLTHALTEHYGLLEAVPYDPKLKELVAAYCVPDNAWYRAIVLEFYGETHYKVVFVDYGNADLVAVNGVHRLEPKFTKLPQQAIRVSLFGMNSMDVRWSGVAISGFSEEILNKACTLTITRKDGDVVVIADIAIEGKSVIDKMVSDGYLKLSDKMSAASGLSGGVVTSPKPAAVTMSDDNVNTIEDIVKISEIAVQQLPDTDEVTVLLAHAVSPGDFSVLMTDNKAAMEMHVKLNEHCKNTTSAYTNFVRDQVVCALYDNVWYRSAVIEAPSSGGLAKLCFFDFGNTERIPVENIRFLPRCFTSVPQQGIPCCLGSVAPFGQWSGKAVDWFTTLLNKCFKAKQLGYKDGCHRVDLRYDDQTGKNVAQEMISLQLATSVIAPDGQLTLAQRSNLTPVARKESAPPSGRKTYRLSDLPKLVVTDEMEVVVVEVINPGLFFCHQAKKESMEALANLINQMDEHCNPLPVAVTFNPQPGEMCCAKYQGNWYRAVVEHRQGNTASVFFVDFGNIVTDDVSNLQPFCSQFCPIPSQAIRCSFAGLRPVGPDWTAEATETFKSLVATADSPVRLYMIVVNRSVNSGSLSVRLVDTTGDDVSGQDVGTQLVTRGVADSQGNNAPESKQSSSLEDEKARCLAEENAKLKQELEELRRMMQQQKL
ncbi:Tudor domain-containing protein 1 [Lamellibrachia satsuma]|nr:Tudor domain-containing protein 1 [Lamellibrachia satsuma]